MGTGFLLFFLIFGGLVTEASGEPCMCACPCVEKPKPKPVPETDLAKQIAELKRKNIPFFDLTPKRGQTRLYYKPFGSHKDQVAFTSHRDGTYLRTITVMGVGTLLPTTEIIEYLTKKVLYKRQSYETAHERVVFSKDGSMPEKWKDERISRIFRIVRTGKIYIFKGSVTADRPGLKYQFRMHLDQLD